MHVKQKYSYKMLIVLIIPLASAINTYGKDISNQQRSAYEAREQYNQDKSDYESLLQQISQQEKYLAEQQQKLNQLNADKVKAKSKLDQSKQHLDAEVKALNQIWELRDK